MPVVAIDGMAGVGKTALAVRAARQLADVYLEGRLFIDLHGYTPGREPVTALQALDRLLRTLSVRTLDAEPDAVRRLLDYHLYATAEASTAIFSSRLHPLPMPPPVTLPVFKTVADGLEWIDTDGANVLATIRFAEASGALQHAWRLGLAVASCFFQRGRIYEMDEALDLALRAAERDTHPEAESRVLLSIGSLNRYRHGAEASLHTLQEARRKLPPDADLVLVLRARLLGSIGYSQAKLNPDAEAIAVLEEALSTSRQTGDLSMASRVLAYLGVAYGDRLEFPEALAAYEEALRVAQEAGDLAVQSEVLNGIGECLLELHRVDEAVTALTTARDLGAERGSDYSLIYTYAFLSTAYTRQERWAEAINVGRRSLALALESESPHSEQNAYLRLAETLLAKGHLVQARPHFARALELALDDGQESVITRAAGGLARTSSAA